MFSYNQNQVEHISLFCNEHVDKITFKMETLKSALQMIRKGCWFAKIDLKDTFYSI